MYYDLVFDFYVDVLLTMPLFAQGESFRCGFDITLKMATLPTLVGYMGICLACSKTQNVDNKRYFH